MASARSNVTKLAVVTFFGIITGFALFLAYRRRCRHQKSSANTVRSNERDDICNLQPLQPESSAISSLQQSSLLSEGNKTFTDDYKQAIDVLSNDNDASIERNNVYVSHDVTDSSDVRYEHTSGKKQDQMKPDVESSLGFDLSPHPEKDRVSDENFFTRRTEKYAISSHRRLDVADETVSISKTPDQACKEVIEKSDNFTPPGSDFGTMLDFGSTHESESDQLRNIQDCSFKGFKTNPNCNQLNAEDTELVVTAERSLNVLIPVSLNMEGKVIKANEDLTISTKPTGTDESEWSTSGTFTESEISTCTGSKSLMEPTMISTLSTIARSSIESEIIPRAEFVSECEQIKTVAAEDIVSMTVESKLPTIFEVKASKTSTTFVSKYPHSTSKPAKAKSSTDCNMAIDTEAKLPMSGPSKLPILLDHKVPFHNESKLFGERKIPTSSESKLLTIGDDLPLTKKSKLPISAETKLHIYADAKSDVNTSALSELKHPIPSDIKRRVSTDSKLPVLADSKKTKTACLQRNIETNQVLSSDVGKIHCGNSNTQHQGKDEKIVFVPPPITPPSDRVSRRKQMRKELIKARSSNPNWMEDWESSEAVAGWKTSTNNVSDRLSTANDTDVWKSSCEEMAKGPSNFSSLSAKYVDDTNTELFPTWGFSDGETPKDNNQSRHGRDISFDDNFVVKKSSLPNSDRSILYDAKPDGLNAKGIGPLGSSRSLFGASAVLKEVIPDCVLEREPLLEDDDDGLDPACGPVHVFDRECAEESETEVPDFYSSNMDSETTLMKLKDLANLLRESERSGDYPPIIELLNGNLDRREQGLTLASLQILVKFSSNPDIVPYLLAARAPDSFLDLLESNTPDDVQIAWLMFLSDVLTTSKNLCLTFSSLPVSSSRVESPLTLYTALYGWSKTSQLKSRAFVLSRHGNELIARLASAVYISLMS